MMAIWLMLGAVNRYFSAQEPWVLRKSDAESDQIRFRTVLYTTLEAVRVAAVLVQPVMPAIADKIFAQLQVGGAASDWKQSAWGGLAQGHQVGAPIPLFPRKDLAPK